MCPDISTQPGWTPRIRHAGGRGTGVPATRGESKDEVCSDREGRRLPGRNAVATVKCLAPSLMALSPRFVQDKLPRGRDPHYSLSASRLSSVARGMPRRTTRFPMNNAVRIHEHTIVRIAISRPSSATRLRNLSS